jgi:hypothetical protein
MKTLNRFLLLVAVVFLFVAAYYAPALKPLPEYKLTVIKTTVAENGLISVQFTDGVDTAAYDYLTQHEYDQFLKHNNPYYDKEPHLPGF